MPCHYFTHAPAVELAERLGAIAPGNLKRVFYSENGSTAVETALKIALQYWCNLDPTTPRKRILCLKNGYHGDNIRSNVCEQPHSLQQTILGPFISCNMP